MKEQFGVFGKYTYLLSCWELDEEFDTIPMSVE